MKHLVFLCLFAPLTAAIGGCKGDTPSPAEEKQLRESFAKPHFDMKDVPPNERAMVQGYIDRSKNMAAQGKPPGQ
jgi:hypothetical protein